MSEKTILLRDALILRPGETQPVLDGADILIRGDRLVRVGPEGESSETLRADETLDLAGRVVMPGLINTHTHSALTLVRSAVGDADLHGFFGQMAPLEPLISRELASAATRLAAMEMIRAGVTTCVDMFQWMDLSAGVYQELGMRAVLVCELAGVRPALPRTRGEGFSMRSGRLILDDGYGRERLAQAVEEAAAVQALGCDRLSAFLGPHALYSCSLDLLAETAAAARRLDVGTSIHLAEERRLEAQIRRRYGSTVSVLARTGLLDRICLGVHGSYLKPADIEQLTGTSFGLAHCPGSNLKLGERLPPVDRFLHAGLPVGLGTDSVMSNDNLDVLEEARLAALAHKGQRRDAHALAGDLALQLATCRGAAAIGLGDRLGRLQPGYLADLIVLDPNQPHWQPSHEPLRTVLYAAAAADVTDVMVGGAWLMRSRQLLTGDVDSAVRHAKSLRRQGKDFA